MTEFNTCVMCGKRYKACGYCSGDRTMFHWRTKCCSPQCAVAYFKAIDDAPPQSLVQLAAGTDEAAPVKEAPPRESEKPAPKPARRSKGKSKAKTGEAQAKK